MKHARHAYKEPTVHHHQQSQVVHAVRVHVRHAAVLVRHARTQSQLLRLLVVHEVTNDQPVRLVGGHVSENHLRVVGVEEHPRSHAQEGHLLDAADHRRVPEPHSVVPALQRLLGAHGADLVVALRQALRGEAQRQHVLLHVHDGVHVRVRPHLVRGGDGHRAVRRDGGGDEAQAVVVVGEEQRQPTLGRDGDFGLQLQGRLVVGDGIAEDHGELVVGEGHGGGEDFSGADDEEGVRALQADGAIDHSGFADEDRGQFELGVKRGDKENSLLVLNCVVVAELHEEETRVVHARNDPVVQ